MPALPSGLMLLIPSFVLGTKFSEDTGVQIHYAGLPFVRSVMAQQVRKELSFFLYLSAIVTGVIMLLFFRSVRAVNFF
ncbi:MAG: hypothetical protein U5K54_01105 [Cytophagales bacterium]|nr:hypothetical protein [Cytophagales bacterium]